MSEYTGLYVQRLSDGSIFAVQVKDPHGNEISLEPDIYVQRGIKPSIDSLPDKTTTFSRPPVWPPALSMAITPEANSSSPLPAIAGERQR
jgi:hypothetical protein